MRRLDNRLTVVGLVVCLPLALLGARSAGAWGPAASDQARHQALDGNSRIAAGGKVRIKGAASTQLYPGVSSPIALQLTNKTAHTLRMGKIKVKVVQVVAPNANATHPCTTADFVVAQMKVRSLRLPKGKHTLASLHVPPQSWPQVGMRNRPVNQDGCKGARLTLSFKARPAR